ncbi:MAG TPA: type II toxin-antitoxin system RelE/ParE family toxin [Enteractinococcus helveticum]|uniref:Type II toxin-antitoxin system RelE/ParE family toxin n=1 Tax=Enteractinococcus helveticum TaxID=1837282 RepID=A0A921FPG0_9MICC|nr:type II toxin-antitoxin system RelE/ParE family toxin [Enteractinococcus helveticum]
METEAYHDLSTAFAWYAEQAPHQLSRFESEIRAAEKELQTNPRSYRPIHRNARRFVLRIFPYRIWYVVNDLQQEIDIIAFIHTRQDPGQYHGRIL